MNARMQNLSHATRFCAMREAVEGEHARTRVGTAGDRR